MFIDGKKMVFSECGRKWGKTDELCYILWRWAQTSPGGYYYVAPYQTQAREIVWEDGRLKSFGPRSLISGINNQEMRIRFHNGSYIKVLSSENTEAARGFNPKGLVVDEFKDFRPEWWVAAEPNLTAHDAPVVFAGTPPEGHVEQFEQISQMCQEDDDKAWFNMPSYMNPHTRDAIMKKKEELLKRGEEDIWMREYEAKRIVGGRNSIFPLFDRKMHVSTQKCMDLHIMKDRKKLQWVAIADPGTVTCFAVLFFCYNPYKKIVYLVDEIYETATAKTTTRQINQRIDEITKRIGDWIEWDYVADEAAAWFINESLVDHNRNFFPTQKASNKKDHGISLIRDQLANGRLLISDKCEKLIWEIENYIKDKNGKIPKENDHLIDCLRYGNAFCNLQIEEEAEPEDLRPVARSYRMEDDIAWEDSSNEIIVPYD